MFLSQIQCLRLTAVLEDCSHQLDILGHSLRVQISRKQGHAAAQDKARLTELIRECQSISKQMSKLHLELEEKQSFSSLLLLMKEEEQKKKAEETKRVSKKDMEQRRQTLLQLQEEMQHKNKKLKELNGVSTYLKQQHGMMLFDKAMENTSEKNNMELDLPMKQKEMYHAEKLLEDQLELLQKKLKEEKRVHEESEKFLQNQHEELQQQLQNWQQLTEQLQWEKKEQLNNVCCKKTLNFDRLMDIRRRFRAMEQVVMEDRDEQEKLQQQQAEVRAATKLQAWWRGCMVRRGLGSFKKEENKKGTKKKDGKKRKKK